MARLMAIDYGTKRTGLAITDELQIIASGLTTVSTSDLLAFIADYSKKESLETIIIGEPKRLHNEASDVEQDIQKFIRKLSKTLPKINIARVDERFTSKMAFQTMIDSGLSKKKRRDKNLVDEISATIILQSYLYSKS
ncbi:Holliday junction resolvase RuvX [Ichthyenterobacterium sp. W332]|uniref:Putative pre-16S rRNA nuclease n=1 Tax=Microcosmobacter mediterraneus TaxID=3075607 RepID=A0ABU2YMW1_9FLAO|nr:Holliday junction resolvase RuvX [Ichthyenterobacterium sp. W332]MDT0559505.1 Holliday junction resolvase RuvX [Ichthyenterobacterium sp. W332]